MSFRSGFKTLSWLTWQKNKARFCSFQKLCSSLPKLYSLLLFVTFIHSSSGKYIPVRFVSINKTFTFMIFPKLPSCVKKEKYSKALIANFWHRNTTLKTDIVFKLMFGPVESYFTLCLWETIHSIYWVTHLKTLNWNYKVKLWKGSSFQKILINTVISFKIWRIIFIWMTFLANYCVMISTKESNFNESVIILFWKSTLVSPWAFHLLWKANINNQFFILSSISSQNGFNSYIKKKLFWTLYKNHLKIYR